MADNSRYEDLHNLISAANNTDNAGSSSQHSGSTNNGLSWADSFNAFGGTSYSDRQNNSRAASESASRNRSWQNTIEANNSGSKKKATDTQIFLKNAYDLGQKAATAASEKIFNDVLFNNDDENHTYNSAESAARIFRGLTGGLEEGEKVDFGDVVTATIGSIVDAPGQLFSIAPTSAKNAYEIETGEDIESIDQETGMMNADSLTGSQKAADAAYTALDVLSCIPIVKAAGTGIRAIKNSAARNAIEAATAGTASSTARTMNSVGSQVVRDYTDTAARRLGIDPRSIDRIVTRDRRPSWGESFIKEGGLRQLGEGIAIESATEFAQTLMEQTRAEMPWDYYEAAQAAFAGAIGGGMVSGIGGSVDTSRRRKNEAKLKEVYDALAPIGKNIDSFLSDKGYTRDDATGVIYDDNGVRITDGELIDALQQDMNDRLIQGVGVIPGSASVTAIPTTRCKFDEVIFSSNVIRNIAGRENGWSAFVQSARDAVTRNGGNFDDLVNSIMKNYANYKDLEQLLTTGSDKDVTSAMNKIIAAADGNITVVAHKNPSTNKGPNLFRLKAIVESGQSFVQINSAASTRFNMDFDGDTMMIYGSYNADVMADQYFPSSMMYDPVSGTPGGTNIDYMFLMDDEDRVIENLRRLTEPMIADGNGGRIPNPEYDADIAYVLGMDIPPAARDAAPNRSDVTFMDALVSVCRKQARGARDEGNAMAISRIFPRLNEMLMARCGGDEFAVSVKMSTIIDYISNMSYGYMQRVYTRVAVNNAVQSFISQNKIDTNASPANPNAMEDIDKSYLTSESQEILERYQDDAQIGINQYRRVLEIELYELLSSMATVQSSMANGDNPAFRQKVKNVLTIIKGISPNIAVSEYNNTDENPIRRFISLMNNVNRFIGVPESNINSVVVSACLNEIQSNPETMTTFKEITSIDKFIEWADQENGFVSIYNKYCYIFKEAMKDYQTDLSSLRGADMKPIDRSSGKPDATETARAFLKVFSTSDARMICDDANIAKGRTVGGLIELLSKNGEKVVTTKFDIPASNKPLINELMRVYQDEEKKSVNANIRMVNGIVDYADKYKDSYDWNAEDVDHINEASVNSQSAFSTYLMLMDQIEYILGADICFNAGFGSVNTIFDGSDWRAARFRDIWSRNDIGIEQKRAETIAVMVQISTEGKFRYAIDAINAMSADELTFDRASALMAMVMRCVNMQMATKGPIEMVMASQLRSLAVNIMQTRFPDRYADRIDTQIESLRDTLAYRIARGVNINADQVEMLFNMYGMNLDKDGSDLMAFVSRDMSGKTDPTSQMMKLTRAEHAITTMRDETIQAKRDAIDRARSYITTKTRTSGRTLYQVIEDYWRFNDVVDVDSALLARFVLEQDVSNMSDVEKQKVKEAACGMFTGVMKVDNHGLLQCQSSYLLGEMSLRDAMNSPAVLIDIIFNGKKFDVYEEKGGAPITLDFEKLCEINGVDANETSNGGTDELRIEAMFDQLLTNNPRISDKLMPHATSAKVSPSTGLVSTSWSRKYATFDSFIEASYDGNSGLIASEEARAQSYAKSRVRHILASDPRIFDLLPQAVSDGSEQSWIEFIKQPPGKQIYELSKAFDDLAEFFYRKAALTYFAEHQGNSQAMRKINEIDAAMMEKYSNGFVTKINEMLNKSDISYGYRANGDMAMNLALMHQQSRVSAPFIILDMLANMNISGPGMHMLATGVTISDDEITQSISQLSTIIHEASDDADAEIRDISQGGDNETRRVRQRLDTLTTMYIMNDIIPDGFTHDAEMASVVSTLEQTRDENVMSEVTSLVNTLPLSDEAKRALTDSIVHSYILSPDNRADRLVLAGDSVLAANTYGVVSNPRTCLDISMDSNQTYLEIACRRLVELYYQNDMAAAQSAFLQYFNINDRNTPGTRAYEYYSNLNEYRSALAQRDTVRANRAARIMYDAVYRPIIEDVMRMTIQSRHKAYSVKPINTMAILSTRKSLDNMWGILANVLSDDQFVSAIEPFETDSDFVAQSADKILGTHGEKQLIPNLTPFDNSAMYNSMHGQNDAVSSIAATEVGMQGGEIEFISSIALAYAGEQQHFEAMHPNTRFSGNYDLNYRDITISDLFVSNNGQMAFNDAVYDCCVIDINESDLKALNDAISADAARSGSHPHLFDAVLDDGHARRGENDVRILLDRTDERVNGLVALYNDENSAVRALLDKRSIKIAAYCMTNQPSLARSANGLNLNVATQEMLTHMVEDAVLKLKKQFPTFSEQSSIFGMSQVPGLVESKTTTLFTMAAPGEFTDTLATAPDDISQAIPYVRDMLVSSLADSLVEIKMKRTNAVRIAQQTVCALTNSVELNVDILYASGTRQNRTFLIPVAALTDYHSINDAITRIMQTNALNDEERADIANIQSMTIKNASLRLETCRQMAARIDGHIYDIANDNQFRARIAAMNRGTYDEKMGILAAARMAYDDYSTCDSVAVERTLRSENRSYITPSSYAYRDSTIFRSSDALSEVMIATAEANGESKDGARVYYANSAHRFIAEANPKGTRHIDAFDSNAIVNVSNTLLGDVASAELTITGYAIDPRENESWQWADDDINIRQMDNAIATRMRNVFNTTNKYNEYIRATSVNDVLNNENGNTAIDKIGEPGSRQAIYIATTDIPSIVKAFKNALDTDRVVIIDDDILMAIHSQTRYGHDARTALANAGFRNIPVPAQGSNQASPSNTIMDMNKKAYTGSITISVDPVDIAKSKTLYPGQATYIDVREMTRLQKAMIMEGTMPVHLPQVRNTQPAMLIVEISFSRHGLPADSYMIFDREYMNATMEIIENKYVDVDLGSVFSSLNEKPSSTVELMTAKDLLSEERAIRNFLMSCAIGDKNKDMNSPFIGDMQDVELKYQLDILFNSARAIDSHTGAEWNSDRTYRKQTSQTDRISGIIKCGSKYMVITFDRDNSINFISNARIEGGKIKMMVQRRCSPGMLSDESRLANAAIGNLDENKVPRDTSNVIAKGTFSLGPYKSMATSIDTLGDNDLRLIRGLPYGGFPEGHNIMFLNSDLVDKRTGWDIEDKKKISMYELMMTGVTSTVGIGGNASIGISSKPCNIFYNIEESPSHAMTVSGVKPYLSSEAASMAEQMQNWSMREWMELFIDNPRFRMFNEQALVNYIHERYGDRLSFTMTDAEEANINIRVIIQTLCGYGINPSEFLCPDKVYGNNNVKRFERRRFEHTIAFSQLTSCNLMPIYWAMNETLVPPSYKNVAMTAEDRKRTYLDTECKPPIGIGYDENPVDMIGKDGTEAAFIGTMQNFRSPNVATVGGSSHGTVSAQMAFNNIWKQGSHASIGDIRVALASIGMRSRDHRGYETAYNYVTFMGDSTNPYLTRQTQSDMDKQAFKDTGEWNDNAQNRTRRHIADIFLGNNALDLDGFDAWDALPKGPKTRERMANVDRAYTTRCVDVIDENGNIVDGVFEEQMERLCRNMNETLRGLNLCDGLILRDAIAIFNYSYGIMRQSNGNLKISEKILVDDVTNVINNFNTAARQCARGNATWIIPADLIAVNKAGRFRGSVPIVPKALIATLARTGMFGHMTQSQIYDLANAQWETQKQTIRASAANNWGTIDSIYAMADYAVITNGRAMEPRIADQYNIDQMMARHALAMSLADVPISEYDEKIYKAMVEMQIRVDHTMTQADSSLKEDGPNAKNRWMKKEARVGKGIMAYFVELARMMGLLNLDVRLSSMIETPLRNFWAKTMEDVSRWSVRYGSNVLDTFGFDDMYEAGALPESLFEELKNASKTDAIQRLRSKLGDNRFEGNIPAALAEWSGEIEDPSSVSNDNRNLLDRAWDKTAKFAAAENMMVESKTYRMLIALVRNMWASGDRYWFEPGASGEIKLVEALRTDPVMFFRMFLGTDADTNELKGKRLLAISQAVNYSQFSSMDQEKWHGVIYSHLNKTTGGKLDFALCLMGCKYPKFFLNAMDNMLSAILPMSTINWLITDSLSNPNNPITRALARNGRRNASEEQIDSAAYQLAARFQMTQVRTTVRNCMIGDVLRMGLLASVAWLASGILWPPQDDDGELDEKYLGNLSQWKICGLIHCDTEWWAEDTIGMPLAITAFWETVKMGKPQISLVVNAISDYAWFNPVGDISEPLIFALDPELWLEKKGDLVGSYSDSDDITSSDYLFYSILKKAGTTFFGLITPGVLSQLWRYLPEGEKSYKTTYDDEGNVVATTMYDSAWRYMAKQNPVVAALLSIFNMDDSYMVMNMPGTTYYDQAEVESLEKYSIYDEDGNLVENYEEIVTEVIDLLNSTDDMEALRASGFYIPADTRAYISTMIYNKRGEVYDEISEKTAAGDFSYGTEYGRTYEEAYAAKQEYYDEIERLNNLYDKLWSEPMRRSMVTYSRANTTYEEASGASGYFATGKKNSILRMVLPFGIYDEEYTTPSAVTGQGMYDENGNVMRVLTPNTETTAYMSIEDWGKLIGAEDDDDDDGTSTKSTNGRSSSGRSGGSGGRGSSSGYSSPNTYARTATTYTPNFSIQNPDRIYDSSLDYLRPNFTTKGSRQAYRREDY